MRTHSTTSNTMTLAPSGEQYYPQHEDQENESVDWDQEYPRVHRAQSTQIIRFLAKDEEVGSIVRFKDSSMDVTKVSDSSTIHESDDEDAMDGSKKQRSNRERRCCCRIRFCYDFVAIAVLIVIFFSTLTIGATIEAENIHRAPSTIGLYTDDTSVCTSQEIEAEDGSLLVYQSIDSAMETNETIVHCGSCGQCSNPQDLERLAATRETLTNNATTCAYRILLGKSKVEACLEDKVGFTEDCNDCWVSNIACTFTHCKFTCLKTKLFGGKHNDSDNDLNDCLRCDEVMWGPQFLECSGANRRRMGIVSDIGRDANQEQCKDVTIDLAATVAALYVRGFIELCV
jgi:hypothetical protein